MRKILYFIVLLVICVSVSFSQEYVGKIVRSRDTVYVNGKYFDKNQSRKQLAIGDIITVCCGGTLIVHFEKTAKIEELINSPKVFKFKIASPDPKFKNAIKRYAAYSTLASISRGGIFEPPLNPPHGAYSFLDYEITFQWNKPGKMFYLTDKKMKIVYKAELNDAKELTVDISKLNLKEGKYYWYIDKSAKVEINLVKF
jgi:hypothetical protein